MDKEIDKKMIDWIMGGDTGESSKTIWAAIMGKAVSGSIPYDIYDFGRCIRLLILCDEQTKKEALKKVAENNKPWKPFVENWEELTRMFNKGEMTKLQDRLRELRK